MSYISAASFGFFFLFFFLGDLYAFFWMHDNPLFGWQIFRVGRSLISSNMSAHPRVESLSWADRFSSH